MSDDRKTDIAHVMDIGSTAITDTAQEIARRPDRREVIKIAFALVVVVSLFMCGVAIWVATAANSTSAQSAAAAQAAVATAQDNRKLAQTAYDQAVAANRTLAERGQPQISVPAPTGGDPTNTIVSAATARVLASLPDPRPTAAALGQAIATYLSLNPVTPAGPTVAQLSTALAAYFALNPPAAGPRGEPGAPGKDGINGVDGARGADGATPTAEQIQAAVCPAGAFATIDVPTTDGGTASIYTCLVNRTSPVTSTTAVSTP